MPAIAPAFTPLRTPAPGPWLNALVSNVQDAIVILDAEGRVVFESASACQILGIPPDDVLGGFGLSRIHPEDREAVVSSFERTIAIPGSTSRATYRFQRADGQWQHLEALAKNLLDDPELRGVLITFRDVSERIHAIQAAESAGRARDAFLYNVSRELSAPVEAILACAKHPPRAAEGDPSSRLEQINEHAAHLLRLVQITTALAGVRNGMLLLEREPVPLDALVLEALDAVRSSTTRADVQIAPEVAAGEAQVLGDRTRLLGMLTDLLEGLHRSSPHGGVISIKSHRTTGHVWLELASAGDEWSDRHLQNVYERFDRRETSREDLGEHGLGVAIAGRLVELMGGAMGVESAPGGGVMIWLQLATL